jgi:hypothetical protein
MNEIKPRIVNGDPLCSDECVFPCVYRNIGFGCCPPGLRQQRDEARQARDEAIKKLVAKLALCGCPDSVTRCKKSVTGSAVDVVLDCIPCWMAHLAGDLGGSGGEKNG